MLIGRQVGIVSVDSAGLVNWDVSVPGSDTFFWIPLLIGENDVVVNFVTDGGDKWLVGDYVVGDKRFGDAMWGYIVRECPNTWRVRWEFQVREIIGLHFGGL